MNILFTGGSSFTGMWFVKELAKAGHRVVAPLLRSKGDYKGTREERVKALDAVATVYENISFGSDAFFELMDTEEKWDALCHHAADVTDYKSPSFDYLRAVANNTHRLPLVLEALKKKGCHKVIITGSVFEQREGKGSDDLRAVSPYGLSKGLTSDVFSYWCSIRQMKLAKFVIPNPFGPYEEERFTSFLMKTWFSGETANVSHPEYVRDNIHVSLLAKAYEQFVSEVSESPGFEKINPSQYSGLQGEFAELFAEKMRERLPYSCALNIMKQVDFSEPLERVNTTKLDVEALNWNEESAWDEIAQFYMQKLS